jgi:hypothetical protein
MPLPGLDKEEEWSLLPRGVHGGAGAAARVRKGGGGPRPRNDSEGHAAERG